MNETELLAHYRPWLRKVAARLTTPDRVEDLSAEAWVELWRAHRTYDGSAPLDWWLKFKARGRMGTVLRNWTTAPHVPVEAEHHIWDQLRVDPHGMELAYHHGEIARAVDALTPRERQYVIARFWGSLNYPELTELFGYQPQGLWRTARPKLAAQLAHLGVTG